MGTLEQLLAEGRLAEASEQATRRLAEKPGDGEALLVLIRVAIIEGRTDAAEQLLQHHVARVPPNDALMIRATLASQRGEWKVARELYASLVRQPSSPPQAWYGLGVARLWLGDLPGARKAQEQALKLGPRQPSVHFELGRILALQGQIRAAVRAFVQTARLAPRDPRPHEALARVLMGRNKTRSALRVLEAALRAMPQAAELQALRTSLLDGPSAAPPAPPSAAPSPEDPHARAYRQARELLDRKRARDAVKVLKEASAQGLRSVPLKLMEAEACVGLIPPDVPGAIQAYEDAMALDPEGWVVGSNFGLFLQGQGNRYLARAVEVLEETHRRAPARPEPALNLALAHHKAGHTAASLKLAERLEEQLPLEHPLYPQARLLVLTLREKKG